MGLPVAIQAAKMRQRCNTGSRCDYRTSASFAARIAADWYKPDQQYRALSGGYGIKWLLHQFEAARQGFTEYAAAFGFVQCDVLAHQTYPEVRCLYRAQLCRNVVPQSGLQITTAIAADPRQHDRRKSSILVFTPVLFAHHIEPLFSLRRRHHIMRTAVERFTRADTAQRPPTGRRFTAFLQPFQQPVAQFRLGG